MKKRALSPFILFLPVSPNKRNTLKTYEILGTVKDYVCEASKQNHMVTLHSDNENEHQTKERSGRKNVSIEFLIYNFFFEKMI